MWIWRPLAAVPCAVLASGLAVALRIEQTGRDREAQPVFLWAGLVGTVAVLLLARIVGGALVVVLANAAAYLLMAGRDRPGVVFVGFWSFFGPIALAAATGLLLVALWHRRRAEARAVGLRGNADDAAEMRP